VELEFNRDRTYFW